MRERRGGWPAHKGAALLHDCSEAAFFYFFLFSLFNTKPDGQSGLVQTPPYIQTRNSSWREFSHGSSRGWILISQKEGHFVLVLFFFFCILLEKTPPLCCVTEAGAFHVLFSS